MLCLRRVFNLMFVEGHVEERGKQTTFSMVPQTGDFNNPGNWRQYHILTILFVWFTNVWSQYWKLSIIYKDQIGFRRSLRMCVQSLWQEWSVPMWCASWNLRKTCARIGSNAWFDALKVQGVPQCSACIFEIYSVSVSWSVRIGTRRTISNQTRYEMRRC